ncbi:hypothetical protein BKA64DRAFT_221062 [Cadophora sp. MPI-SDFR-AT-0126]|nr:hypothetical protein BKA64DRAFT_221062 [Leotiomycetes sp. MPI-SDFR-AT-0126]
MKDIADCILSDTEMRLLILTASDKIGDSRLKQNLAILLEDFAQRLTIEKLFGHLPNFVGSRAPGVIDYVFKALPADRTDRKDTIDSTPTLPTYDDAIFARDEVEDLGEVERTFEALDKLQIKVTRDLFSSLAIQQSTPFQQLSEDLRRFIFPSTKSYIREIIGHSLPHTNLIPIHSMLVRVDCELRKFLSQELDTTADMSEMMTLTGTLIQAQALPCRAYMDQTWPQSGLQILEVVKYALENDKSYYQHGPSHSIQLEILEEYLVAQIDGRPHEIIETVEQLAWLASTFRFGTLQSIGLSQTEFRVVPGPTGSEGVFAEIILRPIRSIPESELSLGSCWTSLFDRSVLAWGFPVAERGDLHGLELSFELLLKASGARFPVEFQESIIIRQGPLTVFPVARGSVGTQWHVTLGGLDEFFDKINSFPLLPVQDDINTFLHGRHVLGWLNRAQLKLGTEQPSNRTSGAKEETSRGFQLGEELSVAVSIKPPWVGTTIGAKFVIPRAQRQRFENNRMDLEQQLERSVNTPALYYDCSTRTGWVVPELSLLLNLVHAHLFRYHSQSDALYDIRYADLLPDGGNAALAAIRSCNTTVLWESRRKGEEVKQYYFSDLVQFYLECFENRKEAIRVRVEHNELKADLGLRGWDYGDLRDCTAFFRYRRISPPYLSGRPDWWSLTKNPNLMVVLGSDIGQVMIPDRAVQRPCSLWSEVPPKRNLLVCLVRCVEEICRPWESGLPRMQLSQKFCWHQPENSRPFGDCLGRGCNPVQKLRDVSGWNPFHGLRNPDGTSPDGAVIFGIPNDNVELQPRSCYPLNVIAPTPPQINHLRTKPTGFPQGWMFELSKTMRKLGPSAADIVPLSVIAGVAGGCVFIFMLRGRRW